MILKSSHLSSKTAAPSYGEKYDKRGGKTSTNNKKEIFNLQNYPVKNFLRNKGTKITLSQILQRT
jgi:hypothetical protein